MYYNVCPVCGAHLDPGEKCDCRDTDHEKNDVGKKSEKYGPGSFSRQGKEGSRGRKTQGYY